MLKKKAGHESEEHGSTGECLYECPEINSDLLPKEIWEERIRCYIEVVAESDPLLAAAVTIKSFNPPDRVHKCLKALEKYLTDIILHPKDEIYRQISSTERRFSRNVLGVEGGQEFLVAVGFEITQDLDDGEQSFVYFNSEPDVLCDVIDFMKSAEGFTLVPASNEKVIQKLNQENFEYEFPSVKKHKKKETPRSRKSEAKRKIKYEGFLQNCDNTNLCSDELQKSLSGHCTSLGKNRFEDIKKMEPLIIDDLGSPSERTEEEIRNYSVYFSQAIDDKTTGVRKPFKEECSLRRHKSKVELPGEGSRNTINSVSFVKNKKEKDHSKPDGENLKSKQEGKCNAAEFKQISNKIWKEPEKQTGEEKIESATNPRNTPKRKGKHKEIETGVISTLAESMGTKLEETKLRVSNNKPREAIVKQHVNQLQSSNFFPNNKIFKNKKGVPKLPGKVPSTSYFGTNNFRSETRRLSERTIYHCMNLPKTIDISILDTEKSRKSDNKETSYDEYLERANFATKIYEALRRLINKRESQVRKSKKTSLLRRGKGYKGNNKLNQRTPLDPLKPVKSTHNSNFRQKSLTFNPSSKKDGIKTLNVTKKNTEKFKDVQEYSQGNKKEIPMLVKDNLVNKENNEGKPEFWKKKMNSKNERKQPEGRNSQFEIKDMLEKQKNQLDDGKHSDNVQQDRNLTIKERVMSIVNKLKNDELYKTDLVSVKNYKAMKNVQKLKDETEGIRKKTLGSPTTPINKSRGVKTPLKQANAGVKQDVLRNNISDGVTCRKKPKNSGKFVERKEKYLEKSEGSLRILDGYVTSLVKGKTNVQRNRAMMVEAKDGKVMNLSKEEECQSHQKRSPAEEDDVGKKEKTVRSKPLLLTSALFTKIRVRLPDGLCVEGSFPVHATLGSVRQLLDGRLGRDKRYVLLKSSCEQLTEREYASTLRQLGYYGSVFLRLRWQETSILQPIVKI